MYPNWWPSVRASEDDGTDEPPGAYVASTSSTSSPAAEHQARQDDTGAQGDGRSVLRTLHHEPGPECEH